MAPVGVFSGFSIRLVDEETDARGVCELLSMEVRRGPPPLASVCLGWFGVGNGGGCRVGVEPTAELIEAAERAETFNGCCGLAARPGLGPGFGGGRCFNMLVYVVPFWFFFVYVS